MRKPIQVYARTHALYAHAHAHCAQAPPAEGPVQEPPSEYVGECVLVRDGPVKDAQIMLAFENQGGWRDVQGAVTMTVLNQLLGGGSSFSSGASL